MSWAPTGPQISLVTGGGKVDVHIKSQSGQPIQEPGAGRYCVHLGPLFARETALAASWRAE
jgi:hypothetical protein